MELEILRVGTEFDEVDADEPRCSAPESRENGSRSAAARVE